MEEIGFRCAKDDMVTRMTHEKAHETLPAPSQNKERGTEFVIN
jgi:hypothetical protein